ncbi:MAG: hypothetical protein HOI95_26325 [Chromatiales bacterium]|nr:hypothetical protein [Chromatiales bacterium]
MPEPVDNWNNPRVPPFEHLPAAAEGLVELLNRQIAMAAWFVNRRVNDTQFIV